MTCCFGSKMFPSLTKRPNYIYICPRRKIKPTRKKQPSNPRKARGAPFAQHVQIDRRASKLKAPSATRASLRSSRAARPARPEAAPRKAAKSGARAWPKKGSQPSIERRKQHGQQYGPKHGGKEEEANDGQRKSESGES